MLESCVMVASKRGWAQPGRAEGAGAEECPPRLRGRRRPHLLHQEGEYQRLDHHKRGQRHRSHRQRALPQPLIDPIHHVGPHSGSASERRNNSRTVIFLRPPQAGVVLRLAVSAALQMPQARQPALVIRRTLRGARAAKNGLCRDKFCSPRPPTLPNLPLATRAPHDCSR